jgi:hypothetical protein
MIIESTSLCLLVLLPKFDQVGRTWLRAKRGQAGELPAPKVLSESTIPGALVGFYERAQNQSARAGAAYD